MPRAIAERDRVFYCFSDCGVCLTVCPVTAADPSFSPRKIVMQSVLGATGALLGGEDIWRCLSCGQCSYRCPANVDFLSLIRELREEAIASRTEQPGTGRRDREAA